MYDFQKKIANTAYHKPHTIGGEISRKEFIREDPMEKLKRKNDFHGVLADPAENELLKGTIQEFFEATLPDITITGRLSVLFFGKIFRNPLKDATHIVCFLYVLFWGTERADFLEICTETSFWIN